MDDYTAEGPWPRLPERPLTIFRGVSTRRIVPHDTPGKARRPWADWRRFRAYARLDGLRTAIRKAEVRLRSVGQFAGYALVEFIAHERVGRSGHLERGTWSGRAVGQLAEVDGGTDLATWQFDLDRDEVDEVVPAQSVSVRGASPRIGLVGAGAFAWNVVVPALQAAGARPVVVADASAARARRLAGRLRIPAVADAPIDVLTAGDLDGVVIACAHSAHAGYAATALQTGLDVLVEKPAATTPEEAAALGKALVSSSGSLRVGHNRRHAFGYGRLVAATGTGPAVLRSTVEAFPISPHHWYRAPGEGGRVLGNLTHWLDLAVGVFGDVLPDAVRAFPLPGEGVAVDLTFPGDRFAEVRLLDVAGRIVAGREEIQLVTPTETVRVRDWSILETEGRSAASVRRRRRDRGHLASYRDWVDGVRTGSATSRFDELLRSHALAYAVLAALEGADDAWRDPVPGKIQKLLGP